MRNRKGSVDFAADSDLQIARLDFWGGFEEREREMEIGGEIGGGIEVRDGNLGDKRRECRKTERGKGKGKTKGGKVGYRCNESNLVFVYLFILI